MSADKPPKRRTEKAPIPALIGYWVKGAIL
jgi:hypothetical protein